MGQTQVGHDDVVGMGLNSQIHDLAMVDTSCASKLLSDLAFIFP